MISLRITHTKEFMKALLAGDLFDHMYLEEAQIDTFNTFKINGLIHHDFYEGTEGDSADLEYSYWSTLKETCFNMIRGKHTPLGFKFVFIVPGELIKASAPDINTNDYNFLIQINFKAGAVTLTTGASQKSFTLDKSAEGIFDAFIPQFLTSHQIDFDQL